MKKLLFTALIAVSVSAGSFAQDVNQIDEKAVADFESTFTQASNVEWASKKNFTKASFFQDNRKVEVFYNLYGEFIATTRHTEIDKVPTFAKKILAKNYSDYTVKEVFKFHADDEEAYYISAENENENTVLKVKEGSVTVYSRTSKNLNL